MDNLLDVCPRCGQRQLEVGPCVAWDHGKFLLTAHKEWDAYCLNCRAVGVGPTWQDAIAAIPLPVDTPPTDAASR
jgi:hypothetical protein